MTPSIKLISLNIERAKHLDRVLPFLAKEQPDVVCLQEIREPDIPLLKDAIRAYDHLFAGMYHHPAEGNPSVVGACIFSRLPFREHSVDYYRGSPDALPNAIEIPEEEKDDAVVASSVNCVLASVDVEKGRSLFKIATTHFLWSRKGRFTEYQREDMRKLLALLAQKAEFVLAGDFNALRGGEIFGMLAAKYKDNVPMRYKTSLDASLHRSGKLYAEQLADKMVDGIFSTSSYIVSDVELICGISDHCAIVAHVLKPH